MGLTRECFAFIIEFYKNILILPETFIVHKNTFEVANFSFDLGNQNVKTSKRDYIKNSLLNYFLKNQALLIEYQLDNQLFEIVELYENRLREEKSEASPVPSEKPATDEPGLGTNHKGTLRECIRGIGLMISDAPEPSKEALRKSPEANVFLKEAELTGKSARGSPNNVGRVTGRFRTCRPSRT